MGYEYSIIRPQESKNRQEIKNTPNAPEFQFNQNIHFTTSNYSEVIADFLSTTDTLFNNFPNTSKRKLSSDRPTRIPSIKDKKTSLLINTEQSDKIAQSVPFSSSSIIKKHSNDSLFTEDYPIQTMAGSLQKDIRQTYKFQKVLGNGHFATVRMVYRRCDMPRRYYAIKSISKENLVDTALDDLIKEVDILSQLDHPNIIKFYETYHDEHFFHIVMELCKGKEVFDRIVEDGKIQEKKVTRVILKVLHTISYCHSRGVTHRDLKPENILFQSEDAESEIKLIDFGLSRKYLNNEKMHTILGTPYYIAPEVLQGEYDEKCDIWSIGALSYIMLCGDPPFKGNSNNDIFRSILQTELKFLPKKWKDISKEAISFIQICMQKKAENRPSAREALQHPWFKEIFKDIHNASKLDLEILNSLKNFVPPGKLKRMIIRYFINILMTPKEIKKYKDAFFAMDYNHSGSIDINELRQGFKLANVEISEERLKKVLQGSDETKKGSIDYSEFIIACVNLNLITKEKLETIFNYFDVNNSGFIESSDLNDSLLRFGKKVINEKDVHKIISDVTQNGNSVISITDCYRIFNLQS